MRALAACASSASASSGSDASRRPGWNDSTAIREATSPACAPPIPSATTNSGERASSESSLARRWRPVSVPAYCSATRSTSVDLVGEFAVADAHPVAGVQRPRRLQQLLVEIGAVGGVQVFDDHYVALLVQTRVPSRGEGVFEADLGTLAAPEDDLAVEVVDHPRIVPGGAADRTGAAERRGRVKARGVRRDRPRIMSRGRTEGRAPAEVAAGAAGHPQQEQVEHGQKAELERDGYGFERVHPSSKRISVEPISRRSPDWTACAPRIPSPLTSTPLVEPRSAIVQPSPAGRSSAWWRDTPASSSTISQSRLRPITPPAGGTSSRRPP